MAGMGPVLALKYFRYTYRSSKINILQQAERLGGPILSLGNIESQSRSLEKDISPLSISQPKNRNPVYEPLLSDSPSATRRSIGPGTPFDFFQSQTRLSSTYMRNSKDNWCLNSWWIKASLKKTLFNMILGSPSYDMALGMEFCHEYRVVSCN